MHLATGSKPLGERHVRRLRQLREANDQHIQRLHLSRPTDDSRGSISPAKVLGSSGKRTVEDVIEARKNPNSARSEKSTAARLRDTISAARGGIQTERSDRSAGEPHRQLLPALHDSRQRSSNNSRRDRQSGTVRSIASVRRRGAVRDEKELRGVKRMGKEEAEWAEKQLQFAQRSAALEKECLAAWRTFYSGSSASSSASPSQSPSLINKTMEEIGMAQAQDSRVLLQQLMALRQKATRIAAKVNSMRDGAQFFAELEEMIEDMEQSLSTFRSAQLETYEKYVLEENMLEKDLGSFLEKLEDWERNDKEQANLSEQLNSKTRARSRGRSATRVDNCTVPAATDESRNIDDDLVKQVRYLNNAIMQSGGMKGGWDERDHAIFASELSKCGLTDTVLLRQNGYATGCQSSSGHLSNQDTDITDSSDNIDYEALVAKLMHKCKTKIVTKTADAIRLHLEWYIEHAKLVDEKKRIVAEWKCQKERQRRALLSGAEDYNKDHGSIDECTPEQNGSEKRMRNGRDNNKSEQEKAIRDQQLQDWKEQKLQQELELEREQVKLQEEREAKVRTTRALTTLGDWIAANLYKMFVAIEMIAKTKTP